MARLLTITALIVLALAAGCGSGSSTASSGGSSGKPVDGIWFSGAEMTRGCIDVFKETGKPLVPMTGEGNNGFFRAWKESNLDSVAAVFTPELGPASLRATVAVLEGKSIYDHYFSDPAPITNENVDKYYRPDLNDAFWVLSMLPEAEIDKTFKK